MYTLVSAPARTASSAGIACYYVFYQPFGSTAVSEMKCPFDSRAERRFSKASSKLVANWQGVFLRHLGKIIPT